MLYDKKTEALNILHETLDLHTWCKPFDYFGITYRVCACGAVHMLDCDSENRWTVSQYDLRRLDDWSKEKDRADMAGLTRRAVEFKQEIDRSIPYPLKA